MWRAHPGCLLLAVVLTGCVKSQDYVDVMHEQRKAWKEMTEILSHVQDATSMAEAKKALDARRGDFEQIATKVRSLPAPSAEVRAKLDDESYVMQRTMKRLLEEVTRVRALPDGDAFFKQFDSGEKSLFHAVQP